MVGFGPFVSIPILAWLAVGVEHNHLFLFYISVEFRCSSRLCVPEGRFVSSGLPVSGQSLGRAHQGGGGFRAVSFPCEHHLPGDARGLVGQRHSGQLRRLALGKCGQPGRRFAAAQSVLDHCGSSDHQHTAQSFAARPRDSAERDFARRRPSTPTHSGHCRQKPAFVCSSRGSTDRPRSCKPPGGRGRYWIAGFDCTAV
jgi:hypothetical protein